MAELLDRNSANPVTKNHTTALTDMRWPTGTTEPANSSSMAASVIGRRSGTTGSDHAEPLPANALDGLESA